MSIGYEVAYRLRLTPWEWAAEAGAGQLTALFDREEQGRTAPFGRALDLGCGTGAHSVELARRGWSVTGVDTVERALRSARRRAEEAGVTVDLVAGDVTDLESAIPVRGEGFRLLLDVGCFHGLDDDQRRALAAGVDAVATSDATLLMLAFRAARRWPLPRGADTDDVESAFGGWSVVDSCAADTSGMPPPLRRAAPRWLRLQRTAA